MDSTRGLRRLTLALALLSLAPPAAAQQWEWAQQAGTTWFNWGSGIALDPHGNAYVAGVFAGAASFGGITLTRPGVDQFGIPLSARFVAKYGPDGAGLWARTAEGYPAGAAIAVAPTGVVYVANEYDVARYSAEGGAGGVWEAVGPGAAVAVGLGGDVYLTGAFEGVWDFGAFSITSAPPSNPGITSPDAFMVRYRPDGEALWARRAGSSGQDYGAAVAPDAHGYAYATGTFEGTATFGSHTLTSPEWWRGYVVRYGPDGAALWVRVAGRTASAVAVDAEGGAYVTGTFTGTQAFGSFTLTSTAHEDAFLARYSAEGEVLWVRGLGGAGADYGVGVAVDARGDVYVAGNHYAASSTGGTDLFVAKYSADGGALWSRRVNNAQVSGLAVNAAGDAYVTGRFLGTATFGSHRITSVGSADAFVAKLSTPTVAAEGKPASPEGALLLSPVWPNPASTRSTSTLTARAGQPHVRAEVLDALGRRVAVVYEGAVASGVAHEVGVEASRLAPGMYVLSVTGGEAVVARRFVVVR